MFSPIPGASVVFSATTTHASSSVGLLGNAVRISNGGTVAVRVKVGVGAQEATATDLVLLGGESIILPLPEADSARHVSVETVSSTATVYATPGYMTAGH
jgi:hypothetical protein